MHTSELNDNVRVSGFNFPDTELTSAMNRAIAHLGQTMKTSIPIALKRSGMYGCRSLTRQQPMFYIMDKEACSE